MLEGVLLTFLKKIKRKDCF